MRLETISERRTMDELLKKLDEILDKYGIVENRDALKDDIYYDIIQEAWHAGYDVGKDPKRFWDN